MSMLYEKMTLAERRVAGFPRAKRIAWRYEPGLFVVDPDGRPRLWTPDFFLPDLGIYVEVVGRPGADYDFRRGVYEENRIPILFVRIGDDPDWMAHLCAGIEAIHASRSTLIAHLRSVPAGASGGRNRRSTSGARQREGRLAGASGNGGRG